MTTPKLTKVVHIRDGKVEEAAIQTKSYGDYVWLPENLKKDGGFPKNRGNDGSIIGKDPRQEYIRPDLYALYDAGREAKANDIRRTLANLRAQREMWEAKLLALYTEEATA